MAVQRTRASIPFLVPPAAPGWLPDDGRPQPPQGQDQSVGLRLSIEPVGQGLPSGSVDFYNRDPYFPDPYFPNPYTNF